MVATAKYLVARMKALWEDIRAQPGAELFLASHEPGALSLDSIRERLDSPFYEQSPQAFTTDMRSVFSLGSSDTGPAAVLMALLEDLFIKHNIHSTTLNTTNDSHPEEDFLSCALEGEALEESKKKRSSLSNKAQKQALAELAGEIAAIEQELALLRGKKMPETALSKVRSNECLVKEAQITDTEPLLPGPSKGNDEHVPSVMPLGLELSGEEALGESNLPQHPFYTELMLSNTYVWDWDSEGQDKNGSNSPNSSQLFVSSAEEGRSTMRSSQANNKRTRSRSSSLEKTLAAVVPAAIPIVAPTAITPPGNKRQRTRSTLTSLAMHPVPGKRAAVRRRSGLLWTREQLLEKITHELPSDMLDGVVMIVNPSFQLDADDDSDLEFDISTLDDRTLFELQQYVIDCLEGDSKPSSPRRGYGARKGASGKQSKQRTRAQKKKHPKSQRRKKAAINTKYNFIPPKPRLSTGLAELAEVFRTEVVIKADKAAGDSDELVDIEGF